jgi:phosphoenolpyruvate-protein phosphotransferase (PTS system enzyme I)
LNSNQAVLAGLGVGLEAVSAEVLRLEPAKPLPIPAKHQGDKEQEVHRMREAVDAVGQQLQALSAKAGETSAEIFEALEMILQDETLFDAAVNEIEAGFEAGTAFVNAVETFAELLSGDPTFEERIADIRDLGRRVAAHVHGVSLELKIPETGRYILVGEDFSPADTAQFTKAIVGVVTFAGGPTSHTAIICRSRSIPAVVSCEEAKSLQSGDLVLVDPVGDRVVVGGSMEAATKALSFVAKLSEPIVAVRANIGSLADAITASTSAARGVGLFRTELLYLSSSQKPSLDQQVTKYSEILSASPEGPIVVRTIDAGSDKPVPFLNMPHEENPALGIRGYRLIKEHREFITEQLAALEQARVKTGRDVWVMAPMIASYLEAVEFAELARSIGQYKIGIMIETPAIISAIGHLGGKLDFVSVGTNDLSQYLFAADRMHAQLGALMNHWQPALISALADIARHSSKAGLHSGVCGESASDPSFSIVLAGLGFDSVSSSPSQVGQVRSALTSVDKEQAKLVAEAALQGLSADQAKSLALGKLASFEG